MNVIVVIEGREAIPVRAIPLLTDWKVMWPDVVAKALAGDEFYFSFEGLCAYRIEGGVTKPIKATWWQGFTVRDLQALSDRINAEQVTQEAGYQKWRKQSLAELPAGVFVWKDEYVPMYQQRYGPDELARSMGRELTQSERQARELDFSPFVPDPETKRLVMEGFEPQQADTKPQAAQTPPVDTVPAPVVAEHEQGNRWTREKLAKLAAYRGTHTMPETAEKFRISEQRIRQLLPRKKPLPSPFTGLIHRPK